MSISPKAERELIRAHYVNLFTEYLASLGEEVLATKSNVRAWPVVGCEGNEYYCTITVTVPTGADKGMTPYDGHSEAESYELHLKQKAETAKATAEKNAKKAAKDEEVRKRKAEAAAKRKG